MPWPTSEDIGARLGRPLSAGEETGVDLLIEGASVVVADAADKEPDDIDPVPGPLRFLAIEVICRAMANPNSLDSLNEQIGSYQYGARFRAEAGLFLTDHEERRVRRAVFGHDLHASP